MKKYNGGHTMKSIYRAALLVAAFVFLLPLSAHSEIKAGSVEVGVFGGYNFFDSSQNLKNGPLAGGRMGYNFTKYFGVEVAGEYVFTEVNNKAKTNYTEGQFGYPMSKTDVIFYHVDAVYNILPDSRFTPFILVGFGGAHYNPKISTGEMPAFNVGAGVKFSLTDNLALRFDVQDYIVTEIFEETYHNIAVTVGLAFYFGGSKPAPVAKREPIAEPVAVEKVVIVAAEPEVEQKVIVAAAEPKIIILAFEDVHFDFDKSTLKPEAKMILKRDIQKLKDNPNSKVRIAGYTSAAGTEDYNQKLSERRAKAVQDYLISEGVITPDRLSTIGYGETHPAVYEAAPKEIYSKAAKANMRVLFEIIVK
jgi:OmpA-OmpF porin, OOP family